MKRIKISQLIFGIVLVYLTFDDDLIQYLLHQILAEKSS